MYSFVSDFFCSVVWGGVRREDSLILCMEVFCPFSLQNSINFVNTYNNLCIHSTVDKHLSCSHFTVMMTSVISIFAHNFCCNRCTCRLCIHLNQTASSLCKYAEP